jgi:hypothetical protein
VRALIWPLFARSAGDQTATVVGCTTVQGAALDVVRLFGVG